MNAKLTSTGDARTILVGLVSEYGQEIAREPRRLEGLLRDLCPASRREIAALTAALKAPVIHDLSTLRTQIPPPILVARLARQLQDNLGLTESLAHWAVESWAIALGITSESTVPAMPAGNITDIETADTSSVADTIIPRAPATPDSSTRPSQPPSDMDRLQQMIAQADDALQKATRSGSLTESLSLADESLQVATAACRLFSTPPAAEAIAVQARVLLVRAAWQSARESQAAGDLSKSLEYLRRVLELQPDHADAKTRLANVEQTRRESLAQAEAYWSACKLPKAISRLEKSLVAFPGDQELIDRLDRWKTIAGRVEHVLKQELPQLKAANRFYTMLQVLCELEATGAPVQGLHEYRVQVEKKLASAEPALQEARGALGRCDYGAAVQQCDRVLAVIPDHEGAAELKERIRGALSDTQRRAVAIQVEVQSGRWAEAARLLTEISEAEIRQPIFAQWHHEVERMKKRVAFYWRFVAAAFGGGVLWILAGILASKAFPALFELWPELLKQHLGAEALDIAGQCVAQLLFSVFLIGFGFALLAGKRSLAAIPALCGLAIVGSIIAASATLLHLHLTAPSFSASRIVYAAFAGLLVGLMLPSPEPKRIGELSTSILAGACAALLIGLFGGPATSIGSAPLLQSALIAVTTCGAVAVFGLVRRWTQLLLIPIGVLLAHALVESSAATGLQPYVRALLAGAVVAASVLPFTLQNSTALASLTVLGIGAAAGCAASYAQQAPASPSPQLLLAVWSAIVLARALSLKDHLEPGLALTSVRYCLGRIATGGFVRHPFIASRAGASHEHS
jgi:tetratricopeptide (TPR) repeat protein